MTFEEMINIDPREMDEEKLVQLSSVHINSSVSQKERCCQFIQQIKNPYCYLDGKIKVKISFAPTERTMDDCVRSYLTGL